MNFANDVLIPTDFIFKIFWGHAEFVVEKIGYFQIKHFENFILNLSLSIEKFVVCTPYLNTYLLCVEQYIGEKATVSG